MVQYPNTIPIQEINISLPHSKSVINRILIIKALQKTILELNFDSESNDVQVLAAALKAKIEVVNIEDAGTPYRFLMAYYAAIGQNKTLNASEGLQKRPIKEIADILIANGASVTYLKKEGFPPTSISGKLNLKNEISIDPSLSSQFVSALMLVAPLKDKVIKIKFLKEPSSYPYIALTANIMQHYGIELNLNREFVIIQGQYNNKSIDYPLEADWTAASYFYAFCVLTGKTLSFNQLNNKSFQGDRILVDVFKEFGVQSDLNESGLMKVHYNQSMYSPPKNIDLRNYPDLAPTFIVLVAILKTETTFTGLENLKIKESNRIIALQTELRKVGIQLIEKGKLWSLDSTNFTFDNFSSFDTHQDHRIAMSLSLFAVANKINMTNKEVVVKSFPYFWKELQKLDIKIE